MIKNLFLSLAFISLNAISILTFSQAGAIDLSFNTTDLGFGFGDGADNLVDVIVPQEDGKVLIGGMFNYFNGTSTNRIARLNQDGSLDNTFQVGSGANNFVKAIAMQANGKIIIGGEFASYNGVPINYIARLNSDGTLDSSFNIGTGANASVQSIAIQPDGKILIGGFFSLFNGVSQNRIVRLNPDGSLDTNFAVGTGLNNGVYSLALQSDGKILVAGEFTSFNGTTRNRFLRLNSDGTLDTGFDIGTGANLYVRCISIQSDDKIVIGGIFTSFNGVTQNRIARLNADGTLDSNFNTGTGFNAAVMAIKNYGEGKLVIGGSFSQYKSISTNFLISIDSQGNLDESFNNGLGASSVISSIAIYSDGTAIIGGQFSSFEGINRGKIAKLTSTGSVDLTFVATTGLDQLVYSLAVQADNKILVGGQFTNYNATPQSRLLRLDPDGNVDVSFNIGTGANAYVRSIAIQNDGKILVAGAFTQFNGQVRNRIARLNEDGSIDESFNAGIEPNNWITCVLPQPDGKILIGGNFTTINGVSRNRIARLNADGTLDTSFNVGSGANASVECIALQADGKIVIGGGFITYNGTSRNRIARLNANGSLDTSFNIGTGFNNGVFKIVVLDDNKILVGGTFTNYNGVAKSRIIKLNTNGSVDTSFDAGLGPNGAILNLLVGDEGKILVGGSFTTFNNLSQKCITRLNSDGSLDTSFIVGVGTSAIGSSGEVRDFVPQSDGKLIIGGGFTSYNGTGRNRVARIYGNCVDSSTPVISSNSIENCGAQLTTLSITSGDLNDAADWQWYAGSCGGTPVGSGTSIDITPTATTTYFARGEGGCVVNATCGEIEISVLQDCGTPLVANDYFGDASSISAPSFPFCSNRFVDLTNATPSPQASTTAPVGAGQDVWYAFVAQTNGARITSTSVACDVVIELHDATNAVIGVENETTTGAEILVANNLTPGDTYYVLVRNFNASSVGTVTTCIQNLAASAPDNGTIFNNLCGHIKCDWNGAQLYTVTFDDGVNQYTASSTGTLIPFHTMPGLQYGTTYDVTFTSTFIQNDAAGNPTTVIITSAPFAVTFENHLPVALRGTDRCPTTRSIGAFIGTDRVICGATGYEWEFTLSDEFGAPLALDPIVVSINANSRYIRTSSIGGVQPGDYYLVRVRPLFSYGAGVYGDAYMLCIAGSAGISTEGGNATPSLTSVNAEHSVKLYPNPNNGEMINIQLTGITSETVQVNVIDALGRVITSHQYSVNNTFNGTILFDTKLSSGMYNVQIIDGEAVMMERVIIR